MPGLDQAPPLPPGLQGGQAPPPPASLSGMAGQGGQPQGDPQQGGNTLQQAVIEKLMLAEGALQSAVQLLPALAPVVDGVTQQLRAQAGRVLAQSVAPQPQSPIAALTSAAQAAPAPQLAPPA